MHKISAEGMEALDLWPGPLIQKARSIDQNIGLIFNYRQVAILDGQTPFAGALVPDRGYHFRIESDTLIQIVLSSRPLYVIQDLGSRCVKTAPVGIGLERKCVDVRRHIASDSRIPVLNPGAPNIRVLVIYG
jgi:hypothetical protein